MTDLDLLTRLCSSLDEGAARRSLREQYLTGTQPLAFLSPEARTAIGSRFGRMAVNVPRVTVAALAERLRVVGFTGDDAAQVWTDWQACDLDQMAPVAHREALAHGEAHLIVWADATGAPLVTVESPAQVAVRRDPATRAVVAAVKRWARTDAAGRETGTVAVLYLAERIVRFESDAVGATTGFRAVETVANPLGVVPVVPLTNTDRLTGPPASEIDDVAPLVDAMNKLLADMLTASEYAGRPRRWATGVELVDEPILDADGNDTGETATVNPFPEGNRMMVSEAAESKFGQLDAADLAGYENAARIIQAQISAVTGLPPHYLGVHGDQPASADALRASEASLTAKAEARQQVFGRSWEQVARLMVAVRTGRDPRTVRLAVQWADPATRSVAQEADAVVKLFGAGLLPQTYALKRLGYRDDEIATIRAATRQDALDQVGADALAKVVAP